MLYRLIMYSNEADVISKLTILEIHWFEIYSSIDKVVLFKKQNFLLKTLSGPKIILRSCIFIFYQHQFIQ